MNVKTLSTKAELGQASAGRAVEKITEAIERKGEVNVILATGASQFETLKSLIESDVDWSHVNMFHLDEYVGMPESHPASFRKFLKERFLAKVPKLKEVHFVEGDADDPVEECKRLNSIVSQREMDVALVGIGENGHLAFNDPPADFETEDPFILVELDEVCRSQQMGEGWFETLEEVPQRAISMSIQQIMKTGSVICSVPDQRKAKAVQQCLEGEVTNLHPASILQRHSDCVIYLDPDSASLLSETSKS